MNYERDRFGVPDINLKAALESNRKQTKDSLFCIYVPTRKEVANLEREKLKKVLIEWMCHSPTEIIPSRTQIAEVKSILLERADSSQLDSLITMCNYYIQGD